MFDFDSLTTEQRQTLHAAKCVTCKRDNRYSTEQWDSPVGWAFTTDWQAWKARVALAVLPDGTGFRDKIGRIVNNRERLFMVSDSFAPYNIVVDEPKPETEKWKDLDDIDELIATAEKQPHLSAPPSPMSAPKVDEPKYETHVMHDGTCYFLPVDEAKPEWTSQELLQAMRDGRQFVAKKEGFWDIPFRQKPSMYCEMRAKYATDPDNGWQIEEIKP